MGRGSEDSEESRKGGYRVWREAGFVERGSGNEGAGLVQRGNGKREEADGRREQG